MSNPSLLPASATAIERAIEHATSGTSNLTVPVRDVWNPDTCPVAVLPWLAWAFAVEEWRDSWPEAVKRAMIKAAIQTRKLRGTRQAVEEIVKSFGAHVLLQEWWETSPRGVPHTFSITISYGAAKPTITAGFQNDIVAQVTRAKPLRSHFTVTAGLKASEQLNVVGYVRAGTYTRLQLAG